MDDELAQLAKARLPESFGFEFSSEFDAASPWSLVLAFYPETAALGHVRFKSTRTKQLSPDICAFVSSECARLGWKESSKGADSVSTLFLKVWLRHTDKACRALQVPSGHDADSSGWIDGVVRVLQLWRRLGSSSEPELSDFEEWEPETVFDALISFTPPSWDLRQRLDFLVLPYLRYKERVDLLQNWILSVEELETLLGAASVPELASPLLKACLRAQSDDWRVVEQIVANLRPDQEKPESAPARSPTPGAGEGPASLESLAQPSKASLAFVSDLVEVARLGKLPTARFQQLAEWSFASVDTQKDILHRFLRTNSRFTARDIAILRKTLLPKVDEQDILQETTRSALHKSKLNYIESNVLKTHPELVREEVLALARSFGEPQAEVSLEQASAALELVDGEEELKDQFERLRLMSAKFGIDPKYALAHEPLENVARALELDSANAYLRYTDLVTYVGGSENKAKIAEQCVEAALADDNFDAVVEFIARGFLQDSSPSAWLAYYQAGKFVSPSWDAARDVGLLESQLGYLSKALSLCPEQDLLNVLRTWSATDEELTQARLQQYQQSELSSRSSSSRDYSREPLDTGSDAPRRQGGGDRAREQISNLLVSGIGWAIGANQ